MCLGIDEKDQMIDINKSELSQRRNSFENKNDMSNFALTRKFGGELESQRREDASVHHDNSIMIPKNYNTDYKQTTKNISFSGNF
jgi:hypothetical protein